MKLFFHYLHFILLFITYPSKVLSLDFDSNTNPNHIDNPDFKKMSIIRTIQSIFPAIPTPEGAGVIVKRSIGTRNIRRFNPFLMFDHFESAGESGFPEHPHLGQETITYMLQGAMAHEDFTGSKGIVFAGDLQFMTASRGMVHSEMPLNNNGEAAIGLQLWVDLPEALKESKPRYRDLRSWEIPEVTAQDGKLKVKVISGNSYGVDSQKDLAYTPVNYYHFTLKPGASFTQPVSKDFNFFLYVVKGDNLVLNKDTHVNLYDCVFFNRDGDEVTGENLATSKNDLEFLLIGGEVLDQEVVQYGPFVATNAERIQRAFTDYQLARNGFENLKTWNSLISNGVTEDMINNELGGSSEKREQERLSYLSKQNQIVQDEL